MTNKDSLSEEEKSKERIEALFAGFREKTSDATAAAILVAAYQIGGLEHQLSRFHEARPSLQPPSNT